MSEHDEGLSVAKRIGILILRGIVMQGVEGCEGVIPAGLVFLPLLPNPPENTRSAIRLVQKVVRDSSAILSPSGQI